MSWIKLPMNLKKTLAVTEYNKSWIIKRTKNDRVISFLHPQKMTDINKKENVVTTSFPDNNWEVRLQVKFDDDSTYYKANVSPEDLKMAFKEGFDFEKQELLNKLGVEV